MQRCLLCAALGAALAIWQTGADCPKDCPPRCPSQTDVQSAFVREQFELEKFWGVFYEIAFHDSTQPTSWPIRAACQRSVKSQHPGDPRNYKDLFSLNEGPGKGVNAICDLEFNVTDQPGVFLGHWSGKSPFNPNLTNIANTVVDVGVAANGTYSWVLEFQCLDDDDPTKGIRFAAVNFYHRNPLIDTAEFGAMLDRLRGRGIGWLADASPGLSMVDQKKCIDNDSYPPLDAAPAWCGQGVRQPLPLSSAQAAVAAGSCPGFLQPLCDLASSVECVASCMPRLGDCLEDKECLASLKDVGLCMADAHKRNASADEVQACLVPDNPKRSAFLYCLLDDPGCIPVPIPPSTYPTCRDTELAGDSSFDLAHLFGDWWKVTGWRKGELVECLPCQQVNFWKYDPAHPLPWPSPTPPEGDYAIISSAWHEQDAKGKYWPMNQTSLWGPRPQREGYPGKEYSLGTMFGVGYTENYTVVHDGSAEAEPFLFFYACGRTKQGPYVSGLVVAKVPTASASLQARITQVAREHGFDPAEWCNVDNSCTERTDVLVV